MLFNHKSLILEPTEDDVFIDDPGIDSLPYFDLEHFPGMKELSKNEVDPSSSQLVIPQGMIFGNDIVSTAQVNDVWLYHYKISITLFVVD